MTKGNDFTTGPTDGERLTKREYFAAMAMQGLLNQSEIGKIDLIGTLAVGIADNLIEALNKEAE
jgi:hypothetical protein